MAIARAQLVDLSVTRWYHCVTRCVRRAFLLGEGDHNRKQWLQNRLEELAGIFAVSVGGFSVMLVAIATVTRVPVSQASRSKRLPANQIHQESFECHIFCGLIRRHAATQCHIGT
jgi:hypothetical protein